MSSLKGDTGIDVSTTFNDKVTIVGDHPNHLPSVYTDPTGIEINNYSIDESSGMSQTKSAIPRNTPIDNAGDFHGGTMTTTVLNSLHFEVANGGITMETGGNISFTSSKGIFNIMAPTEVCITAGLIFLNTVNTIMVNGPTLYVNTDETIFNKNVQFGNNVMVRGGAVINGELMAQHITTQRQLNFTEECDELNGYPRVGAILNCNIVSSNPLASGPAMITVLPSPSPLVAIPAHEHIFEGPACTLTDGITDLFSKMKSAEGDSPVEASPTMPCDEAMSEMTTRMQTKMMNRIVKYMSDTIGL